MPRKNLSKNEAEHLLLNVKPNEPNRSNARYSLTDEQYQELLIYRANNVKREFVEVIKKKDKHGNISSTTEKLQAPLLEIPDDFELIKITNSPGTSQQWAQYKPKQKEVKDFDIDSIIKKHIGTVEVKYYETITTSDFDMLTFTDVHIGMDTNKNKNSMYPVKWDKEALFNTADVILAETLKNRRSPILYIDELGDLLDGMNEKTTRGGHNLPQNMIDEESFDNAIGFKMYILDRLVPFYDKIVLNNICNDNHAGKFGYFVNSAVKQIVSLKYKTIEVNNYRQFLNHYFVGNVCFVITHGKDDVSLKFGLPVHLDAKTIEKIDQYLKHNNIYKKANHIVIKKGDSHQALFDMCTSDDFFYFNYPALSPSSQWVQNNFKKGRRGFVIENYKDGLGGLVPKFF